MHKKLLEITLGQNHIEIMSYSFFVSIAVIVVIGLSLYITHRRNIEFRKIVFILVFVSIAFLIGARLANFISNYDAYKGNLLKVFYLEFANFDMYGGLIFAGVFGIIICRALKVDLWKMADCIVIPLGLSIILVRIGCFLNGCCVGIPTKLPWGVSFPFKQSLYIGKYSNLLPTKSAPLHPTQIYEILAVLIGIIITFIILKMKKKFNEGTGAIFFSIWYITFRLFNESFRAGTKFYSMPIYYNRLVFFGCCIILIIVLINHNKKKEDIFHGQ